MEKETLDIILALLGMGLTLFVTIIGAAWYLSARLTRIEGVMNKNRACGVRTAKSLKHLTDWVNKHLGGYSAPMIIEDGDYK